MGFEGGANRGPQGRVQKQTSQKGGQKKDLILRGTMKPGGHQKFQFGHVKYPWDIDMTDIGHAYFPRVKSHFQNKIILYHSIIYTK